jgi:hypothetical protein
MAQQNERVSQEDIDAIIANMAGQGRPKPSNVADWVIFNHPSTGEPLYYLDPATGSTIPIRAAPAQGPQEVAPRAAPPSQLRRLDANFQEVQPGQPFVYVQDPNAPAGSAPFKVEEDSKTGDPSQWQVVLADPSQPNGPKIVYDPKSGKMVGSVPAPPEAQQLRTGVYTDMVDPNNPKRVIAKVDTGSKELFRIERDPATQKQFVNTGSAVLVFDDEGKLVSTTPYEKGTEFVAVNMGDQAYAFDPKTGAFTAGPKGEAPTHVGVSTDNEYFTFFRDGVQVGEPVRNPSYRGPQQTAAPPMSDTSPTIPRWNPKSGQWEDVPNTGRVTIGQATQAMITELTGQAVDPNNPMTPNEADALLRAAIGKMNADAQREATKAQAEASKAQVAATREGTARAAAGDILSGIGQGATTGAGLLNQRQATTQALIGQGIQSIGAGASRSGNYGGGMLSPVPGFGADLVQGAMGVATEMGGGQAVFDTAVRMVQAADPQGQNPDRAAAVATLTQMMERYKQVSGQEYPTVAATLASQQSQQQNAFVPPPPPLQNYVPSPQGGLMQPRQWNTPAETAEQAIARAQSFTAPPLVAPVPVLAV